jgi:hypothetical protein
LARLYGRQVFGCAEPTDSDATAPRCTSIVNDGPVTIPITLVA